MKAEELLNAILAFSHELETLCNKEDWDNLEKIISERENLIFQLDHAQINESQAREFQTKIQTIKTIDKKIYLAVEQHKQRNKRQRTEAHRGQQAVDSYRRNR